MASAIQRFFKKRRATLSQSVGVAPVTASGTTTTTTWSHASAVGQDGNHEHGHGRPGGTTGVTNDAPSGSASMARRSSTVTSKGQHVRVNDSEPTLEERLHGLALQEGPSGKQGSRAMGFPGDSAAATPSAVSGASGRQEQDSVAQSRKRAMSLDQLSSFLSLARATATRPIVTSPPERSGDDAPTDAVHDYSSFVASGVEQGDDCEDSSGAASDDGDSTSDDLDENPVFVHLSQRPSLRRDMDDARLVLVPRASLLRSSAGFPSELLDADAYVASHAFAPSGVYQDQYISVRSLRAAATRREEAFSLESRSPPSPKSSSSLAMDFPKAQAHTHDVDKMQQTSEASSDDVLLPNVSIQITLDMQAKSVTLQAILSGRSATSTTRRLAIVGDMSTYHTVRSLQAPPIARAEGFHVLSRPKAATASLASEKVRVRIVCVEEIVVTKELLLPPWAALMDKCMDKRLDVRQSPSRTRPNDTAEPTLEFPRRGGDADAAEAIFVAAPTIARTEFSGSGHDSASDTAYLSVTTMGLGASRSGALDGSMRDSVSADDTSRLCLEVLRPRRNFYADLALLLDPPPALRALRDALTAAWHSVRHASMQLVGAYVLVKGYDVYNVGRVRRGIVAKAWLAFEEARERLCQQERTVSEPQAATHGGTSPSLQLGSEARARLRLLLENVAMGHCHSKLFAGVLASNAEADDELDWTLHAYAAANVGMLELDVRVPAFRHRAERLTGAVEVLGRLAKATHDELDTMLFPVVDEARVRAQAECAMRQWRHGHAGDDATAAGTDARVDGQTASQQNPLASLAAALNVSYTALLDPNETGFSSCWTRTPLDTLEVLRATIEEVGLAASGASMYSHRSLSRLSVGSVGATEAGSAAARQPGPHSQPLGADELLPVLAYVVVHARPRCLVSSLVYARTFGLSNLTPPEVNWALTTFEAVVDYLRQDPLGLRPSAQTAASAVPMAGPSTSQGGGGARSPGSRTASMSSTASSHYRPLSPGSPQTTVVPTTSHRPPLSSYSTYSHTIVAGHAHADVSRQRRISLPVASLLAGMSGACGASGPSSASTSMVDVTLGAQRERAPSLATSLREAVPGPGDAAEVERAVPMSPTWSGTGNDRFKVPALPATAGSASASNSTSTSTSSSAWISMAGSSHAPRRTSRSNTFGRPASILGSLDEGQAASPGDAARSSSRSSHSQESSNGPALGMSLPSPAGSTDHVHIRPQIVVRTRRTTSSSLSASDRSEALSRSGSVSPSHVQPVRVVGGNGSSGSFGGGATTVRHQASLSASASSASSSSGMVRVGSERGSARTSASASSSTLYTRRKSLDSWSTLNLLGAAFPIRTPGWSATGAGKSQAGSVDASRADAHASHTGSMAEPSAAPASPPSAWQNSFAAEWGRYKRNSSSSRPASLASLDGGVVASSASHGTFPRSNSGSGLADASISDAWPAASVGCGGSSSLAKALSIRSTSSGGVGSEEGGSVGPGSSSLDHAQATSVTAEAQTPSIRGRRKRTRLLSASLPSPAVTAPQLANVFSNEVSLPSTLGGSSLHTADGATSLARTGGGTASSKRSGAATSGDHEQTSEMTPPRREDFGHGRAEEITSVRGQEERSTSLAGWPVSALPYAHAPDHAGPTMAKVMTTPTAATTSRPPWDAPRRMNTAGPSSSSSATATALPLAPPSLRLVVPSPVLELADPMLGATVGGGGGGGGGK